MFPFRGVHIQTVNRRESSDLTGVEYTSQLARGIFPSMIYDLDRSSLLALHRGFLLRTGPVNKDRLSQLDNLTRSLCHKVAASTVGICPPTHLGLHFPEFLSVVVNTGDCVDTWPRERRTPQLSCVL